MKENLISEEKAQFLYKMLSGILNKVHVDEDGHFSKPVDGQKWDVAWMPVQYIWNGNEDADPRNNYKKEFIFCPLTFAEMVKYFNWRIV